MTAKGSGPGGPGHVLVTGATGKTGVELIRVLEDEGVPFVGGVRRPHPAAGHPQVRFDWDDRSTWGSALTGVRALYLVKPEHDPGQAITSLLAAAPDVERVVLMSEMGRGRKPGTDPERQAEIAVQEAASSWTLLRPSWFFQNFSAAGGYGEPIRRRGVLALPSGDARFSLVDTRDVARAALVALTTDRYARAAVTLTGPRAVSMADVAAAISAATGRHIEHESASLEDYRSALLAAGADPRRLAYLDDLLTDVRAGAYAAVTSDLTEMTGQPARTLEQFVAENVGYWRS